MTLEGRQINFNTLLLSAVIVLGGIVWSDIRDTLKAVRSLELSRIADSKDIADLQRRVNMLEQAKGRSRSDLFGGNPFFRFRARGSGGTFSVPHKDAPDEPDDHPTAPKPDSPPNDKVIEVDK